MISYPEEFNVIVDKAKEKTAKRGKPLKVAVAAADCENILLGVFQAQKDGFIDPVLIGNEDKIEDVINKLDIKDAKYSIHVCHGGDNPVQYAIEMINAGDADILMRGNVQTRDYLMPILNKSNHLIRDNALVTHVCFLKVPNYKKILGISDVTLLINPTEDERVEVVKNLVSAMEILDIENPNIALLALVEKPSYQMRDTVEDQNIVRKHLQEPYAKCNIVGPIAYDLIISKEAARLKNYDCPYCGDFDGIVVPNLISGNLMVKILSNNAGATGFGLLVGAKIPIAIASRSDDPSQTYLSLAACVAQDY